MRAFLALELPLDIKAYLQTVIAGMAARIKDVRWVREEGFHITLKFLGEIEKDTAWRIKDMIPMIGTKYAPLPASIKSIDAFPSRRRAKVVVVKLRDGIEKIRSIFDDVEKGLLKLNIEPEEREYTPHITLGRVKRPQPLLEKNTFPLEEKRFVLDKLVLFQSILTKEGAQYTPQGDIKLGGQE
ncbi:MAG: RNA 2',3'-cyclic phosphodiesterase [Syntrophobacterales bacterium]|nr:RNA 2',3'-cyclic phosphodiesterase [Syntrophobacterales bacterium]